MPTSLGPAEILVILVVALIVLGPKRLPEAGRQVGKAVAEIRRWSQGVQSEIKDALDPETSPPEPPGMPEPAPIPPAMAVPESEAPAPFYPPPEPPTALLPPPVSPEPTGSEAPKP